MLSEEDRKTTGCLQIKNAYLYTYKTKSEKNFKLAISGLHPSFSIKLNRSNRLRDTEKERATVFIFLSFISEFRRNVAIELYP